MQSLIVTCRLHQIDPYDYLVWTASSSMAGRTTIILAGRRGMIVVG